MHGAIRRPCRRHELACRTESASSESPISNLQITNSPQISPQHPCKLPLHIPPGHTQPTGQLIFVIFISLGTRRAKCKKTMCDRIGYEYASKMQASSCLFYAFHVSTHFLHHMLSKLLFLLERGQHFCKTTSSDFNQNLYFFDPQTASIRAFL